MMQKPLNPYTVLALSLLMPGAGHVAIGAVSRGLIFAFFVFFFSILTYVTTTPDQSFIGRYAGGLFVWALSVPDAYRRARISFILAGLRANAPSHLADH